jgi:transposase-like protein
MALLGRIAAMSPLPVRRRFPDDAACWTYLEAVRWPNGPVCPHCGAVDDARSAGRVHYLRCNACKGKFRVTHGTPFEGTHLPLRTWFTALSLIAASGQGISSVKLAERLGIGQKTAWFLGRRIRRMIADTDGLARRIVAGEERYPSSEETTTGRAVKTRFDGLHVVS